MTVSCYAGASYPERPRALLWAGHWLAVAAVEARWRTPSGPTFRVRVVDGRRFTLAYQERAEVWISTQIVGEPSTHAGDTQ